MCIYYLLILLEDWASFKEYAKLGLVISPGSLLFFNYFSVVCVCTMLESGLMAFKKQNISRLSRKMTTQN